MKKTFLPFLFAILASTVTIASATATGDEIVEVRRSLVNKYHLNEQQMIVLRPALSTYLNSADKAEAEIKFKEEFVRITGKPFSGF